MAWIEAVLRHAAYRASMSVEARALKHEMPVEDVAELQGPDRDWETESEGAVDAVALCGRLAGREAVACRLLADIGPLSERELARYLGVSQPTAHRVKRSLAVKLGPWLRP